MRSFFREARAVFSIWWLVVPGGILGVVGVVQAIRGVHHVSAWLWVAAAMTALWLATSVRLARVVRERNIARVALADEHSREATVLRLERMAREWELLAAEIPPDEETDGGAVAPSVQRWQHASIHLNERVRSELRQNAPGFLAYWGTDPEPLPPNYPFAVWAQAFVELSARQVRHIADRLSQGHDVPSRSAEAGWPHSGRERQGSVGGEPTGELREDRQVDMEPDAIESSDAEREE